MTADVMEIGKMVSREFLEQFATLQPPGTIAEINNAATALGISLPQNYVDLLLVSDGLLIELDEMDVLIYGSGDLVERNQTYETQTWLGDVVRIGDDGGGMGFHLHLVDGKIVAVGSGCPSIDDGWIVSPSLEAWMQSRFAVDYEKRDSEHSSTSIVRVSLIKPLAIKELAALKECLKLKESIMQLSKRCAQLPAELLKSRLDLVRKAVKDAPHLASALCVEDPESGVRYRLDDAASG